MDEVIKKIQWLKIASPPSVFNEEQKQAWSGGLVFGIDKALEILTKIHNDPRTDRKT